MRIARAQRDLAAHQEEAESSTLTSTSPKGWFQDHGPTREGDRTQALAAMKAAYRASPEGPALVAAFVEAIREDQQAGRPLSVLGHSALTLLLTKHTLAAHPELEVAMHEALGESWRHLTGRDPGPEARLERLPKRVLSGADRVSRAFHHAVYQSDDLAARKADPRLFLDYVPERQDVGYVLLTLAALTTEAGLDLLTGGAIGVVLHSYIESFFHNHAGHATAETLAMAKEGGLRGMIGREFEVAEFGHRIHHQTYRSHVRQFKDQAEKTRVTDKLLALGAKGQEVIDEGYGVTVHNRNVFRYLRTNLIAAGAVVFGFKLAPLAVIGLALPTIAPAYASKLMHPYLHMTKEEAMQKAGPLMRLLLSSRYVDLVKMLHYLHHKGGLGNFNIQPPIGDRLTGELHKPTVHHLLKMNDLKML